MMERTEVGAQALDATVAAVDGPPVELSREQRKAYAAVAYYEAEVEACRRAMLGTSEKAAKYGDLLRAAESDMDAAETEYNSAAARLAAARDELERVR